MTAANRKRADARAVKVAVSIPAAISSRADAYAKRLGISRSEVFARALRAHLGREDAASITARLNEVYAPNEGAGEAAGERAHRRAVARRAIERGDW